MKVFEVTLSLPISIKLVYEAPDRRTAAGLAMSFASGDPKKAVRNAAMVFSGTPSVEDIDELH